MKLVQQSFLTVTVAILTLNLTGCGGVSDQPDLGQVKGTITLDGQPLAGMAVVFFPENGRPAKATTTADGTYDLIYVRETRGTKLGKNRVEIAPSEGEDDADDAQSEENAPQRKAVKPSKPKIPARYNTKSELQADVKPGENVFDFKLET
ncbi:hypothetical protein Pan44_14850 [Caulifigura coniformis]|uniref:Carboxypeptidase regulatory-like domain-containing protein n=1 Tax=Caulifigura coniformis TaxID=2527983 RepID=A0A517SBI1_9PLAN|nr:carboxypeptidase regulatory-like domain-containing protein [Caulifigura coniformis]QDT53468.1 hypothetical protein Pan44_14850 [Caulifigura coniformis]